MLKLQALRKKRRLSQESAAREIGVSYWSLQKSETGAYRPLPGSPLATKLEAFYGQKLARLLSEVP